MNESDARNMGDTDRRRGRTDSGLRGCGKERCTSDTVVSVERYTRGEREGVEKSYIRTTRSSRFAT